MEWIKLNSKLISEAAYDEADLALHVRFHNGSEKVFSSVFKHTFENLISAESPGFFYATYISEHYSGNSKAPRRSR